MRLNCHILCFLLILTLSGCADLLGQVDSVSLSSDKMGISDIHITQEEISKNKIYTTSRLLNEIEELPFSHYIITSEDILNKGLYSLGDVLKLVPGMLVSQPGSAVHGETFKVNGLLGNTHAKIMIDNVAIKSFNMSGAPIGEQLPIRQADHIEITYGPSAVNDGSDAGAVSINIVTRQSERPLFVYADLGLGTGRYNTLNVQFGGKIGKKKNTLRFKAYGSSSSLNNLNIETPYPYFNKSTYPLNSFSVLEDTTSLPNRNLPQSNRQLGFDMDFRSFNISIVQMQRTSHAAIGSNPLSLEYNNPATSYGERISIFNFLFKKDLKKFSFSLPFKAHLMSVNDESFFEYNFPYAKQQLDRITNDAVNGNTEARDSIIGFNDERYFTGRRFASGSNTAFNFAPSISLFPIKNVELFLSSTSDILSGRKFLVYRKFPNNTQNISDATDPQINTNLIAKVYLKLKQVNLIFGLNSFTNINFNSQEEFRQKLLPQFAALYKPVKGISIRANYSNSYLIPSTYWNDGSAAIPKNILPPSLEENIAFQLNPQETKYGELGIRWNIKNILNLDLALFKSKNTNLISFKQEETEDYFLFGYDNSNNASANLTGLRMSIFTEEFVKKIRLKINANFSYTKGNQDLPNGELLDDLLEQPKYISQISLSFYPIKKLNISIDNIIVGKYLSSAIQSLEEYNTNISSQFQRDANWSINLTASLHLDNNFNIFSKVNNYSSFFLPGLDATSSPDDLSLNIQRNTYILVGVNYTLD